MGKSSQEILVNNLTYELNMQPHHNEAVKFYQEYIEKYGAEVAMLAWKNCKFSSRNARY